MSLLFSLFFFFNDTATTEIYTLSLHDALPIPHGGLCPRIGLVLHGAILEHRLDDEVAVAQGRIVRRRGDAPQQGVAVRRSCAALVDLLGDELVGLRLALVGGL